MGSELGQGRAANAPRDRARRLAALRSCDRGSLGQGQRADAARRRLDQWPRGQVQARRRNRVFPPARIPHWRQRVARRRQRLALCRREPLRAEGFSLHDLRRRQRRLVPHLARSRPGSLAPGWNGAQREHHLQGSVDTLFALPGFSAVERAQIRIFDAGLRLDKQPRDRNVDPVLSQSRTELRCDSDTARDDPTWAANQRTGALPLPRHGGGGRRRSAARPYYRHQPLRIVLEAQPEFWLPAGAGWLRQHPKSVRRRLLYRSLRSSCGDFAVDAAAGGRIRVQPRTLFIADPDPEISDAPGSRESDHAAVLSRAATADDNESRRMEGPRFSGQRRVREIPPICARERGPNSTVPERDMGTAW